MSVNVVVTVPTGPLTWIGHVVACPECGADSSWTLLIESPADVDGELAWAVCANAHRGHHPLVYPEFVRWVAEWAQEPARFGGASDQLATLRQWEPHWLSWTTAGDESTPGPRVPIYRGWREPGPVEWRREWPELAATDDLLARLAEWTRTANGVDLSITWESYWGSTSPDRLHVALVES